LLTAFAGSIGIIGISLILALSNGVNDYINNIQKDTMVSYPLSINAQTLDMTGMITSHAQAQGRYEQQANNDRAGVYSNSAMMELNEMFSTNITENNLTAFKQYLEDPDSEIQQYLGENGVVYTYNVNLLFDSFVHFI
jgi:putative ABC transport system permease protein